MKVRIVVTEVQTRVFDIPADSIEEAKAIFEETPIADLDEQETDETESFARLVSAAYHI